MSCYHPLRAFPVGVWPSGKTKYKFTDFDCKAFDKKNWLPIFCDDLTWNLVKDSQPDYVVTDSVLIPCGQCKGCRLSYSREWANRMLMELPYHDHAYFLTLTYNNQMVPYSCYVDDYSNVVYPVQTLDPRHLELFWKRLRRDRPNDHIRYFAAGEYGEESWRPHYHAIVFGLTLTDLEERAVVRGNTYYTSVFLDEHWCEYNKELKKDVKRGFVLVGDVTWQSCAYVARYCMKKAKGYNADLYRSFGLEPEFCRMSKKPGLGRWFYDDHPELYDCLNISLSTPSGGIKFRPPRYFDKLLERDNPTRYEDIKAIRREVADSVMNMILSKTDLDLKEYLEVQEALADNKLKMLLRSDM